MGLKDTLADPPRSGCGYAAALADLSADDREAVEAAVADPRWPLRALSDTLKRNGIHITADHVGRHRRGLCRQCR